MVKKDWYSKIVLGVKIDCISMSEVLKKVKGWVVGNGKKYIVTPNSEIVIQAQKDKEFKNILNKADLKIPDGIGLIWAINKDYCSGTLISKCKRVAGVDVMLDLCKLAALEKWRVYFLGGEKLVAKKAAEKLRNKHLGLEIKGSIGLEKVDQASQLENKEVIEEINRYKPDLLFVGFGHGRQEKWINKNLRKLKVKVAMGVGGSFNYLVKPWLRAPKFMQKLGLEWFWRLVLEPWRIKRQLKLVEFVRLVYLS